MTNDLLHFILKKINCKTFINFYYFTITVLKILLYFLKLKDLFEHIYTQFLLKVVWKQAASSKWQQNIAEKLYRFYKGPLNIVPSSKKGAAIVYLQYLLRDHSKHR